MKTVFTETLYITIMSDSYYFHVPTVDKQRFRNIVSISKKIHLIYFALELSS